MRALALAAGLALLPSLLAAQERIVSIGGDVTEIVYALGAGQRVVAVDSTSLWPPEADALPDVGYVRALSAEPIVALAPDLVLASAASGPPAALEQLRAVGTRLETITDAFGPAGVIAKIDAIARVLHLEPAGSELADSVRRELDAVTARLAGVARRPRVLFVLGTGRGAPMAAGSGTAADSIIGLAGGLNAVTGYQGYKPLSPEAALLAQPEVVLAMSSTVERAGGPAALLSLPELRDTPAARRNRLVSMEGMLLLGFGPRTPAAIRQLGAALHPELGLSR
jgi:iron complex transport system substrate-binding protein